MAKLTPAVAIAMMATTTISYSSVKPLELVPATNVGILTLAAWLAVRAEGEYVHLAA